MNSWVPLLLLHSIDGYIFYFDDAHADDCLSLLLAELTRLAAPLIRRENVNGELSMLSRPKASTSIGGVAITSALDIDEVIVISTFATRAA